MVAAERAAPVAARSRPRCGAELSFGYGYRSFAEQQRVNLLEFADDAITQVEALASWAGVELPDNGDDEPAWMRRDFVHPSTLSKTG